MSSDLAFDTRKRGEPGQGRVEDLRSTGDQDGDVSRIQQESHQLHEAFTARTAGMEILTADDLKVRVK